MSHSTPRPQSATRKFEAALAAGIDFELELFVAGTTANSARAVATIRRICDEMPPHRCRLTVVDVYANPELVRAAQIVAVPTLVRRAPAPVRKLVGDLSDQSKVLEFLHPGNGSRRESSEKPRAAGR